MPNTSIPEVIKGPTGTPPKKAAAITDPNIKAGISSPWPWTVRYCNPSPLK